MSTERDQIADVEQIMRVMDRVAEHRDAYLLGALNAADKQEHYDAERYMHTAYEFDRMYESLRARRARLER